MKKLIGIIAVLMALMTALPIVSAMIYFPLPIDGKVSGVDYPAGMVVKITNMRTGISDQTTIDGSGYFLYDWANSNDNGGQIMKYQNGDVFKVELPSCSNAACVKQVTYTGQGELYMEFQLNSNMICYSSCSSCCTTCPNQTLIEVLAAAGSLAIIGIIGILVKKYTPYKGKLKIERIPVTKNKVIVGYNIKVSIYEQYTKADGTVANRWRVVDTYKEAS